MSYISLGLWQRPVSVPFTPTDTALDVLIHTHTLPPLTQCALSSTERLVTGSSLPRHSKAHSIALPGRLVEVAPMLTTGAPRSYHVFVLFVSDGAVGFNGQHTQGAVLARHTRRPWH